MKDHGWLTVAILGQSCSAVDCTGRSVRREGPWLVDPLTILGHFYSPVDCTERSVRCEGPWTVDRCNPQSKLQDSGP